MKEATGDFLLFLDADDVWCEGKLERQVTFMESHPEFRFSHASCWVVDVEGRILRVRHEGSLPDSGRYWENLLDRMWVSISTVAVRRDLWNEVGGFTENREWGGEEDLDFSLRCSRVTEFGTLHEPLAKYRVSAENWTSKKWKGVGRDYVAYQRVFGCRELWDGAKKPWEMRKFQLERAIEGCQYWRVRGEWMRAGWFALQSVRQAPFSVSAWRQVVGVALGRQ